MEHTHDLLVEFEDNNISRLKLKLLRYFQSKDSNGGECEIDYKDGERTAVLHFRREEDQKGVLEKGSHQINVENHILNMTVRLLRDEAKVQETSSNEATEKSNVGEIQSNRAKCVPAPEGQTNVRDGNNQTAAEAICSTSALLQNIPENVKQMHLELLVENILRSVYPVSGLPVFNFEFLPEVASAVVTFQNGKETSNFVAQCPENNRFKKMGLSVKVLKVTQQVLVEAENIGRDILELYFENKGGHVESIEVDQYAIITFKEQTAAQKILKVKHTINKKDIKVFPFHKSLGTALYGKEKPQMKLPNAFTLSTQYAILAYLNRNKEAADSIRRDLKDHHCIVNLDQLSVHLSPMATLGQQKDAKVLINQWRERVEATCNQSLSKFRCLEVSVGSEAWEENEETIRQMLLKEDVVTVPDEAKGVISVAGPVDVVDQVEKNIHEFIIKMRKQLQRKNSSKTETIKLLPAVFSILIQGEVMTELVSMYPELQITYSKDGPDLIVTGLVEEIAEVRKIILNQVLEIKSEKLEMDPYVLDLLKQEGEQELTNVFLTSYGINAAFKASKNELELAAVTDGALKDAKDHLGKLLISQYVDVEDRNVFKMPEWDHQVRQTQNVDTRLHNRIQICTTDQQVVVSGHKDVVRNASRELENFLKQNAHVEETVVPNPNVILKYIKSFEKSKMEQLQDKVAVSFQNEAICLSGSRANVLQCKTVVENLVSSVLVGILTVSAPGAKKWFENCDNMASHFNETGCLVQLVDETSGGQGNLTKKPNHVYQLQTSDGTEIAIYKADICSHPVDAVVTYANEDLKLVGALAQALINAARPQLQKECDNLIQSKGRLKTGDCAITASTGQLCCENIIHAVAPRLDLDRTKHPKGLAHLKKAIKGSLELAEKNGCMSVALPALSVSSGFPLKLGTDTIVKAVREHIDEKHEDSVLKRIHFVDTSDSSVAAIVAAVEEHFKGDGATQSSRPKVPSVTASTSAKTHQTHQSPSDPVFLCQAQTKEGLSVSLVVGKIEDATTDVIVNSVFAHLDLNRGALSRAIFRAAGPELQVSLNAQTQMQNGNVNLGDIIVTEGCQLKSKFVYHAVTPSGILAKVIFQRVLSKLFMHCLNMAEDNGMTSISFPSIGTGGLGFAKDAVAQMLYDEISKFSSKRQTKRLTEVTIILYSKDKETQQVFTEEFQKNLSKGTVSGHFSKTSSSPGMHETKMGSVTIQAVTGDITKETTDVIVNSSNDNFSLKTGVSKAILEAAGTAVKDECKKLAASTPKKDIIMTESGSLQCKKIIHVVGQTKGPLIHKVVKSALQMCAASSYTSVSFPAIGTGQGNVKAIEVADAMFDAVIDVLSQNSSTPLKTVRIVIFQSPMMNDFYTSMQQREASGTNPASWIETTMLRSKGKPQKDFVIKPVEVEPVCFHICGTSQADVDSTKKKLNDLISKEHTTNTITDKVFCSFSQADLQRMNDIQVTLSVKIMSENKQGKVSVTIEGLSRDVLEATNAIQEMLRTVRDAEDLKVKVELVAKVAAWQYQQGAAFHNFDSKTNYELEEALVSKAPSVDVTIKGQCYTVQMPSGPATDKQGNSLPIRRADKEDLPEHWTVMPPNTTCHIVTLAPGTAEYKEVQQKFQATCPQAIITIERIQNPTLWKSLQIKKSNMEQKNGHQNNEKVLFHGTSEDTLKVINELGFNRSYAGKNAAHYGNGTYFAVHAKYSAHNTYSKPNQNNEKHVYLCRVLTGDYTLGLPGMVAPPPKASNPAELYDSAVDNQDKPNLFVVFHDGSAYPEYLIKFK